jgi:hypothetical protein
MEVLHRRGIDEFRLNFALVWSILVHDCELTFAHGCLAQAWHMRHVPTTEPCWRPYR